MSVILSYGSASLMIYCSKIPDLQKSSLAATAHDLLNLIPFKISLAVNGLLT
jgi:hypothetical protein